MFHFVFFISIVNDWGWRVTLNSLCDGVHIVESQQSDWEYGVSLADDNGCLSQYMLCDMTLSTWYGPSHLWSNFFIRWVIVMFFPLSQTLSLTAYRGASLQWALRMGHYVADHVKGCDLWNHMKTFPSSLTGKLMPNQIPNHFWQVFSVNLIMELFPSWGYNTIMVVVDHLSKQTHIIPTTSDITAAGVAQLFHDHMWKLHGLQEEVISDWGMQFVSNFTQSLSQLLGVQVAAPWLITCSWMARLKG